jgi:hypothetical protein
MSVWTSIHIALAVTAIICCAVIWWSAIRGIIDYRRMKRRLAELNREEDKLLADMNRRKPNPSQLN